MARLGIFLSSITARPPSTFFSCALSAEVAATIAVAVMNVRRAVSICSGVTAGFSAAGDFVAVRVRRRSLIAPCLQVSMQSMQATQRL